MYRTRDGPTMERADGIGRGLVAVEISRSSSMPQTPQPHDETGTGRTNTEAGGGTEASEWLALWFEDWVPECWLPEALRRGPSDR
jgi:hypothetical protein